MTGAAEASDTIDVADVARSIARGWRWVLVGLALGLVAALAVLRFVPARFRGTSSVVIRAPERGAGGLASRLGGSLQDAASGLLPGALSASPIETEIQILSSRAIAGEAVDSLRLQARIRGERRAPWRIFSAVDFPGSFKRKRLHVERNASTKAYAISGAGSASGRAGESIAVAGGHLTIDPSADLDAFDVDLYDREEAVTRFGDRWHVSKPGGEVLVLSYQADDSLTAAAVPNLVVRRYLVRRQTTDRGINERKVEFLTAQVDSNETALSNAERALRQTQETSGVIDPVIVGKLELERASDLRKSAGELDVERGAVGQLLSQLGSGQLTARQLAAYPTFLKSPAVNELLGQLSTLETKRLQLMATLTPKDPQVIAATDAIHNIENQLAPLARAYQTSLDRQRSDVTRQLDTLQGAIAALPATSELALRRQRDVLRLAQIGAGVRAQLVDAKLAAIGEGGDVRLLDVAEPPRKVSFPTKTMALGGGLGGGLVVGVLLALLVGSFGRYVRDATVIQRQLGVPTLTLDAETPLLIGATQAHRTILLVPLDAHADTEGVAQRMMRSGEARGLRGTVLDLSNGAAPKFTPSTLGQLSDEFDLVVVRAPRLSSDTTVGVLDPTRPVVLVASAGKVDRRDLSANVDTLRRVGVPCAGVVLSRGVPRLARV